VLGIGGLGHLAVQYAQKMGFKTVAIARGQDKVALAKQLGAWRYIDSQTQDPAAELQKLGGAKVILATVTAGDECCPGRFRYQRNAARCRGSGVPSSLAAPIDLRQTRCQGGIQVPRSIRKIRSISAYSAACDL